MWESPNRRWRQRGPVEPVGPHGLSSFPHPLQISQRSGKLKTEKKKASSWERPGERQSLRWLLCVGPTCFPYLQVLKHKSPKLMFTVAALKRNFEKTPDCRITFYLSFDALISLSLPSTIRIISAQLYSFTKRCWPNSLPHLCKESHFVRCYLSSTQRPT